jgi:peptidoglycan/LPS O-acetylase OafA/YrhL
MVLLGDIARGRDNNFNLVRMTAASLVIVSHAFPIAIGRGLVAEPLEAVAPMNLGRLAVVVFFFLSGFFITKSFDRRRSIPEFLVDRALRLMPGLLLVLAISAFLMGPLVTALDGHRYFATPGTWKYLPRNAVLIFGQQWNLPGVFGNNPMEAVNGSLHTLFWEVMCYLGVLLLGVTGMMRQRQFAAFGIAFVAAYLTAKALIFHGMPKGVWEFALPFFIGATGYVYRGVIRMHWAIVLALIAAALLVRNTPFYSEIFILALCYATLWLGLLRIPFVSRYNKLGDYSYGTYLYGFPVEQLIVWAGATHSPYIVMAAGLPIAWLSGAVSWHLIEHRALARKSQVGAAVNAVLHRFRPVAATQGA